MLVVSSIIISVLVLASIIIYKKRSHQVIDNKELRGVLNSLADAVRTDKK